MVVAILSGLPPPCLAKKKQAGAELCQAQEKLELARNFGRLSLTLELRLSLIYLETVVVFNFAKN
jgi:hypothetical protein